MRVWHEPFDPNRRGCIAGGVEETNCGNGSVRRGTEVCDMLFATPSKERKTFLIVDFRHGFGSFRSVHVPARQRLPCNHVQSILDPQIDSFVPF
jgi:hypothetical protein